VSAHFIDTFDVVENVNKALYEWITHTVADQNLTAMEFRIIDCLVSGKASNASQCSRHLRISQSKVSVTIDKLERLGYVQRKRDQPDRRFIALQLSDEGLRAYSIALSALHAQWGEVLANLGTDIAQMGHLLKDSYLHLSKIL
jgi:DNA-binding MarR family transcriptional regulator